ncbi:PAS domain-containing sensor histidine kinase [Clostridium polyendosporum]|uniref:histidine kinase n=1 Tax=Clostridium polyendosporum TaxID=69208 RepID=A0A919RWC0_9CLOT|nr:ATP-binding protein [Clostridium polyendosporum]GIM27672.1 PAS domain-containing sensor histidine kinase [Clostridium polyendosporum]
MDKKDVLIDSLYIDNKKVIKFWPMYIISFAFLIIAFIISEEIADYLVRIINIIICFGVMLMTAATSKFSKYKLFIFSGICFFIIGLLNSIHITTVTSVNEYLYYSDLYIQIKNLAESLYLFMALKLIYNNYSSSKALMQYVFLLLFAVILMQMSIYFHVNVFVIRMYILAIILILASISLIKSLINTTSENNKINYFSIFISLLVITYYLNFINLFIYKPFIQLMIEEFTFLAYSIIYISLSEKLLNKPYKTIFNDTYERTLQLEVLNREIYLKNKEMENGRKYLKERETVYRTLFNNIPLPMVIINNNNKRIIYANKQFLFLFRLKSIKDAVNKSILNFLVIKENTTVKENNCLNYEGEVSIEEKRVELEIREFMLNNETHESMLIFKDITEKRRIERIKINVEQKKLEEKMRSDFLSTISHDLKTPINVIYSAAQLIKIFLENDNYETIKKYNIINKDNCMTLIRLTNNLIDNSQINYDYLKPQLAIFNIVEIIEDTIMHLAEYIKSKDLDLIFDTEEEELLVSCDKGFIERIILNLISNAVKYTKKGSIFVNITCNDSKVFIQVIDSGKGISKEYLENAFKKYMVTDKSRVTTEKSTGLGLYVVKSLVELQGGQVIIESNKDKGTKVELQFMKEKGYEKF